MVSLLENIIAWRGEGIDINVFDRPQNTIHENVFDTRFKSKICKGQCPWPSEFIELDRDSPLEAAV